MKIKFNTGTFHHQVLRHPWPIFFGYYVPQFITLETSKADISQQSAIFSTLTKKKTILTSYNTARGKLIYDLGYKR